jgi:hypothetical protein
MGMLDELIGDAFGSLFGTDIVMGAALFLFMVYVLFKSGTPTSGIIFMSFLMMGILTALGYISVLWYGIVLAIGAYFFWRSSMAVSR